MLHTSCSRSRVRVGCNMAAATQQVIVGVYFMGKNFKQIKLLQQCTCVD